MVSAGARAIFTIVEYAVIYAMIMLRLDRSQMNVVLLNEMIYQKSFTCGKGPKLFVLCLVCKLIYD